MDLISLERSVPGGAIVQFPANADFATNTIGTAINTEY